MSPSDKPKIAVEVIASDAATELYVIDGNFNLVGRGIGRKRFELDPGIYKVKARAGKQQVEKLVVVREGIEPVRFDALLFSSPIPLDNTATASSAHVAAAQRAVEVVQVEAGTGSGIVIVARHSGETPETVDPSRGLRLRAMDGRLIADVEAAAEKSLAEGCAICHVRVDPGSYRLALELADGRRIEQTLFAAPGWHTRVYLLTSAALDCRADVSDAAITMRPKGTAFDGADSDARLVEIAREALLNDRRVLSDELRARLLAPDISPMLGIIGMHLFIREAKHNKSARESSPEKDLATLDNLEPVRTIIGHLRASIGRQADVEAVAIGAGVADPAYAFDAPPMLTLSWRLLLKATAQQPHLLPRGSFGEKIAPRLWGSGLWLQWIDPETETNMSRETAWMEKARRLMLFLDDPLDEPEAAAPPETGVAALLKRFESVPWLSRIVSPLAQKHPEHRLIKLLARAQRAAEDAVLDVERVRMKLDPDRRKLLVKQLGIPMAAIDAWLESRTRVEA